METSSFFSTWDHYMTNGAFSFIGLAVIILLYHEFRIFQIKDLKEKYDYVNLHEIKYFWYAVLAVIVAAALYANTIGTTRISAGGNMLWFYVRVFITISFAVIAYFVFFGMVRIYYPASVDKRLRKLLDRPRISPDGNVMRKLREDEEETHLDAKQLAEQASEVHSVNYIVWIDDKTGFKKIEKYNAYQHAEECTECGYFTMKLEKEEIENKPTTTEPGLLLKHFKCSYCGHREAKEIIIAKLNENVS